MSVGKKLLQSYKRMQGIYLGHQGFQVLPGLMDYQARWGQLDQLDLSCQNIEEALSSEPKIVKSCVNDVVNYNNVVKKRNKELWKY